jgi:hypothetical protein
MEARKEVRKMRKGILTILGKVRRKELAPSQIINLMRAGPLKFAKEKEEKAFEILSALWEGKTITATEAAEWLEEEGVYEDQTKETENFCQA